MLLFGPKLSTIIAFYDSYENLCSDSRVMSEYIYHDFASFVAIIIFFSIVVNQVISIQFISK